MRRPRNLEGVVTGERTVPVILSTDCFTYQGEARITPYAFEFPPFRGEAGIAAGWVPWSRVDHFSIGVPK